jgi:hypothetical protein
MTRRVSIALFAGLTALVLAGCASYQLGTGREPKFTRVFVAPVHSDVSIPQAEALLTTAIREAFARDGRVTLAASADDADATLVIAIGEYRRDVTVVRPDDTGLARRFDVVLRGRATLTDTRAGKVLFANRPLEARRGAFTDNGQLQSEYQNLPLLAEDLARAALRATLDTW